MTGSCSLWVGIGCKRGTPHDTIAAALTHVFVAYGLVETAIAAIGTIDHKVSEVGLVEFCRDRQLPLLGFSAAALRAVTAPHPSAIAHRTVGTPSVAEAAAILAYQEWSQGAAAQSTSIASGASGTSGDSVACDGSIDAVPQVASLMPPHPLLISKQIFRLLDQPGAVTLAVAGDPQRLSGWVQDWNRIKKMGKTC